MEIGRAPKEVVRKSKYGSRAWAGGRCVYLVRRSRTSIPSIGSGRSSVQCDRLSQDVIPTGWKHNESMLCLGCLSGHCLMILLAVLHMNVQP